MVSGKRTIPPDNRTQSSPHASFSIRILALNNTPWLLLDRAFAPAGDVLSIGLDRQVLRAGERFQMKVEASEAAIAHFSFILNQREDFTVIA